MLTQFSGALLLYSPSAEVFVVHESRPGDVRGVRPRDIGNVSSHLPAALKALARLRQWNMPSLTVSRRCLDFAALLTGDCEAPVIVLMLSVPASRRSDTYSDGVGLECNSAGDVLFPSDAIFG